jgi:hypothetical protein
MLHWLMYLNSALGVFAALGFFIGLGALERLWTARQMWPLSIATFWTFSSNLILALALALTLFIKTEIVWATLTIGYVAAPFILSHIGGRFADRRWILPLTSLLLLAGSSAFLYLGFSEK